MTIARDIRKSQFVEITESQPGDYFDLVRNGQNLKIKQSNLISDFGTIGTLSTRGEVTGIPSLYQDGADNYIRNIVSGPGITASLSVEDGVEIEHNITADKTGTPVMINETTDSPTIRSLIGGTGINITGIGDYIQIAYGVPASSKTVFVYSIADFPTPVAGVITLADNTEYKLQTDVSSANRFVIGANTVLSGTDPTICELEYTGSGTMITAVNKTFRIKNISLTATSGTMFDVSAAGANGFIMQGSIITCTDVGTLDDFAYILLFEVNFFASGDGIVFADNFQAVLLVACSISIPSGTGNGITLGTATFDYFLIDKTTINVNTSGYVLSGLAASGNINAGGIGVVTTGKNFGTATSLQNITAYDDLWAFHFNAGGPDSRNLCLATRGSGTIAISALGTPVIIGATWTEQVGYRFSSSAGGRFTYSGRGDLIDVTVSIAADIATASDSITFFLYKNGVSIAAAAKTVVLSAGTITDITLIWSLEMAATDYLELWVQNDDTNVDVRIDSIVFRAV